MCTFAYDLRQWFGVHDFTLGCHSKGDGQTEHTVYIVIYSVYE